ncbi:hypothetical protein O9G_003883 [Rozella allomycis CSF55]|uniref:Calcineurin-like phosphoesterase domain-containing protein n=1 Tax=Rozella allomycis (strain CSF55) TaxID=988480 RepID=A0A075B057_ROZAC|nr:hypothetical protein O9G_003883 [Rozella allomycis CSF55]|eukprot:EPZ35968.1 hypothetical protein O9G_003883 [Rozella allomycis CSF55]
MGEKRLTFPSNRPLKLIQITDLHYGEGEESDSLNDNIQTKFINLEKPDFVIFSGDLISGDFSDGSNGWYEKELNKVLRTVRLMNTSYAFILGNHDIEADLTEKEIMRLTENDPLSHTRTGILSTYDERHDYILPIYNNGAVEAYIVMLFTGRFGCGGFVHGWGCVESYQVAWLKAQLESFDRNKAVYIFIHIPTREYMYMFNNYPVFGTLLEPGGVGCSMVRSEFVATVSEFKNVLSISCGHDHENDFGGLYGETYLLYGRKTGYGGYGPGRGKFSYKSTKANKEESGFLT